MGERLPVLPPGRFVSEVQLGCNKEWDETAELQFDSYVESNDF